MPIIEHSETPMADVTEYRRERALVSKEQGATSLTVKELELQPGWEGRLHTHSTDIAIMVMAGAVQIVVDDEIRTVRAGSTLLAPPGTPHKLINELWIPAQLLAIYPTTELETAYLE